ncbi:MAG TPA: VOC family protein [Acidimicrobiia bacterium]|nr:VOC family protein [Acidimicrobiia bacterium]
MAERTEYTPGTPNWVDLQTTDQAGAKKFYGELLGWSYNDLPVGDNAVYSMATLKGRDVGAIAGLDGQPGVPPHWNSYVSVSDVDATTSLVEPAGGTVLMQPFDVMDAGRMSVIQDPTGAVINLWQAKNHPGAGIVNETGAWSWNELMTADIPKAAAFYKKVLGWEARTSDGGGGMAYTEWVLDGRTIGGGMNPPMPGIPSNWGIYFSVADCDASVAKAQEMGATVFAPPMDIPVGRFSALADPQGAMFSLIRFTEPAD